MFTSMYYDHWEYWQLYHKVTVDYLNRLIYINDGVTSFDIKTDLYSDLKELWGLSSIDYKYSKFKAPVRVIGGDNTSGGQTAGDIYFMHHGWRVVYDPTKTAVTGVLFSDDYDTPWLYSEDFSPIYPAQVASLVTGTNITASGIGVPTEAEIAAAVWASSIREITNAMTPEDMWNFLLSAPLPGSAGEKLKQVLTTGNFMALK